jgi:hypothetical protein
MSQREAAVKLTLDSGQFAVAIKKTGDEVDKLGTKGKKSMDLFGTGMNAAKRSLGEIGGAIKNTLKMALTLGGAFSVGTAVREAVKLRSSYARLSFSIRTATGGMTSANDVQQIVEHSAAKSAQTNSDMAATFDQIFQSSGDLAFSKQVLDSVGTASLGTGESLGVLAALADDLHDKFDVSAEGMLDRFAQIKAASAKGGPTFAQFSEAAGSVGAELLAAGLQGQRGLDFMIGSLINTNQTMKSLPSQIKGIKAVLRGLGNESDLKALSKDLGIDPKVFFDDKDAMARMHRVLGMGEKGVKALEGSMKEGEEKQVLKVLFTDPFKAALKTAQDSGLKGKAAIDAALVTFDGQVNSFGKTLVKGADLQKEANDRAKDPEAQLTAALNRLTVAFGQPAIIKAIDDLAKHLPALADLIGKLVSTAVKHPIATAAGAVGAKVALAGGEAVAGAVAGSILKSVMARVAGAIGGAAAAGAGGAAAGGAAVASGAAAAGGAGVVGVGASAVGIAALAVPAAILAAIGAGGLIIGDQIKSAFEDEGAVMKELSEATASGFGGGTLDEMKAKLARVDQARATAKKADVGGGVVDTFARAVSDGPDTRDQATAQLEEAKQASLSLERRIREREQANAAGGAAPSPAAAAAAAAAKPMPVQLDRGAPGMIAAALTTGLSGTVLTVRLANAGELGLGRATPGPGGSRGPKVVPPAAPGGGF